MHKPHVVTVEWVVQSLRLKRAAPEAAFLHPDFRTLVSANKENFVKKIVPEQVDNFHEDSQMVQQYLTTDHTEEEAAESVTDNPHSLFSGLTFQLSGLEKDSFTTVNDLIITNGGRVVYKNAEYIVSEPISKYSSEDQPGASVVAKPVNTMWIEDCIDQERLVEIDVYHRPIKVRDSRILAGCVVSFSGIQGRLRELLDHLVGQLGGRPQETFSRKLMEEKNVYRSTHLVCAKPEGKKYEKAFEWGVPVVEARWVIACATSSDRPNEKDYVPTVEAAKPLEQAWESTCTDQRGSSGQPTEVAVMNISRQNILATPAGRLPAHFDMSTPQTPLLVCKILSSCFYFLWNQALFFYRVVRLAPQQLCLIYDLDFQIHQQAIHNL